MSTILDNLARLSDEDLITVLPYIRDEAGEKMSLIELKHFLREEKRRNNHEQTDDYRKPDQRS